MLDNESILIFTELGPTPIQSSIHDVRLSVCLCVWCPAPMRLIVRPSDHMISSQASHWPPPSPYPTFNRFQPFIIIFHRCYYPHTPTDSVSPVYRIFIVSQGTLMLTYLYSTRSPAYGIVFGLWFVGSEAFSPSLSSSHTALRGLVWFTVEQPWGSLKNCPFGSSLGLRPQELPRDSSSRLPPRLFHSWSQNVIG